MDGIISKLGNLENNVLSTAQPINKKIYESLSSNRQVDIHKDARVSVFANLAQILRTVKICYICKVEYLDDMDWYKDIYIIKHGQQTPTISPSGIIMVGVPKDVYQKDFDQIMLLTLVHCSFSAIESSLRIFMRTIDATVSNNSTGDFINIYPHLLNTLSLKQHKDVLDLFRLIRNTVHNNGVYMHKSKSSETAHYRGNTYAFTQGLPTDYGDPYAMMILNIIPDVIDMLKDIINSPQLISEIFIEDPLWKSNPNP